MLAMVRMESAVNFSKHWQIIPSHTNHLCLTTFISEHSKMLRKWQIDITQATFSGKDKKVSFRLGDEQCSYPAWLHNNNIAKVQQQEGSFQWVCILV